MSYTLYPLKKQQLQWSELAVPGSNPAMIEKAADSNVDYILFDLEDAVAPPDKVNARANIIQALNDIDWKAKGKTVSIRINGLDTHYMYRDVVEILEQAGQHLDTILVPKVGVASDLYTVETMVSQIEEAMRFTHKIGLEAKVSFDDNTLFRRPEISELRDKSQEDARETFASDNGLSYIGLEGQIGCIVNGAGLAMATLDMIKMAGGEPANFLDVGGGASPDRVLMSFKAVLNDPKVAEILVNIFAGINRCDWVAEGVIRAMEELNLQIPIVVRL